MFSLSCLCIAERLQPQPVRRKGRALSVRVIVRNWRNGRQMSQKERNKDIVRRFLGAVETGELDTIKNLQARDCTWWIIGSGKISRESYTQAVEEMLLAASSRAIDVIGMVAEGDTVAAEVRSEIKFGERVYANEYHDLFVIKDGKIVHGREYFDTCKVAAFFGGQGDDV